MLAPRQHEDAQDHAARRAHRAQDRDVAALVLHHHDHAGDDVEGGDDDDQRQDQEHDVALDLDRVEEARIGLLPVDDARTRPPSAAAISAAAARRAGRDRRRRPRDSLTASGMLEEELRRGERHIDEAVVVFVHADIEQCRRRGRS